LSVPDTRIVNASPLIFLSRVGLLEVLRTPPRRVIVPAEVRVEIGQRGPDDPTVQAVDAARWLEVVPSPELPASVLAWGLGPGESTVLALALEEKDRTAVLDDRQGRRCASMLGIPFIGTLSLVLRAKELGMVPLARPVLERLRAEGMYLSDLVLTKALAEVGE
jgi:predicted nucleic acid-binding protein